MQWLMALEIEQDMITVCRMINVFRRKGLKIVTLTMATRPAGFSMMAVVESAEGDVEHIFNFLRRTEGVQHVTYYRHEPSEDASFFFIDGDTDTSRVTDVLKTFPGSKLIFASHGKYLLEVPAESRRTNGLHTFRVPEFLPFARVKTTRGVGRPELITARA
jgi:acetolactate synthase regulatory subunit